MRIESVNLNMSTVHFAVNSGCAIFALKRRCQVKPFQRDQRLVEKADDQQGALTVVSRSQSHQAYRRLNAPFAHSQNFSAAGLTLPFREIMPT